MDLNNGRNEMKPEQAKQILQDAPEGATHVENGGDGEYLKFESAFQGNNWTIWTEKNRDWEKGSKYPIHYFDDIRSLSDLRQIVEQADRIEALEKATKAFVSSLEFEAIDDINGACTIDSFDNVALLELQELLGE